MFVLFDKVEQRVPIKVWLSGPGDLEASCREQALNLANLPFAVSHIALMPDTHSGYGMPIGGVLAAAGALIPNAVGVDIGCGVAFVHTDLPADLLRQPTAGGEDLGHWLVGQIMRAVPTGFKHQKQPQASGLLDEFKREITGDPVLYPGNLVKEIERGYYQLGTLGGGNHFIELQEDDEGKLGIMVHSGSRNFGYQVCRHFNQLAKGKHRDWAYRIPPQHDLAYLPEDTKEGQAYIRWMQLALDFARENRRLMLERVVDIVSRAYHRQGGITEFATPLRVNAHHNYAAKEKHFGQEVWVHRKGAISAKEGEYGIIPGAMGGYSYIGEGLGNPQSFTTCSHGAGRKMGRRAAMRRFSVQEVMEDLKAKAVFLGKQRKRDVAEEYIKAYKDIDEVMAQQMDLITPILRLKTVCVVKG